MEKSPLPAKVIEQLGGYDSPTVANAIEHFEVRDPATGYATNELVCQTPWAKAPMVGYAVTCTADTTTPGDNRPQRIADIVDLVDKAPKPTVLVIQHVGHERRRACLIGDMWCTIMHKLGCVGIVTDCNVRDLEGIHQHTPEFQLFAGGTVVSHGFGVYMNLNTTVSVYGLTVSPGDLLHGDVSGVVSVPTDVAEATVGRAEEVRQFEAEYFEFLESDRFNMDELRRRIQPPR